MWLAENWSDYRLIDAGNGSKLERWGDKILLRPDPTAIWPQRGQDEAWRRIDAIYNRSDKGGGSWEYHRHLPERWSISYNNFKFFVGTMGFKHTGVFPEQAVNWDWMTQLIGDASGNIEVLNLFAYTGGATVACTAAGAEVVHVDASKGMVAWAKENMELSGLRDRPVRYIVEDCLKFVRREARRGRKYRGIIMDPPSYGRGPSGEVWKIEDNLFELVTACKEVFSEDGLFFLINSYSTGLSATVIANVMQEIIAAPMGGRVEAQEIGLPIDSSGLALPCGVSGRWSR